MFGRRQDDFTAPDGGFNDDYLLHLQSFGPAPMQAMPKKGALANTGLCRLAAAFQVAALRASHPVGFSRILRHLVEQMPKLAAPQDMGGTQYDAGRYAGFMASHFCRSKMTAARIDVAANMNGRLAAWNGYKSATVKESFARAGIDLPESIAATIFIIAPANKMAAAQDMLCKVAGAEQEPATHGGLGLQHAIARQYAGASPLMATPRTAWFEIYQGVFFTLDERQFAAMATALGIAKAPAAPASGGPRR